MPKELNFVKEHNVDFKCYYLDCRYN